MYVNPLHRVTDHQVLFALMASHPLGAWVCQGRGGLIANHVPFLVDSSRGPYGLLIGHVSRANGVWRQLADGAPCVVMFMGPQSYITPTWYPGKQAHGRVVPTWNYVTVHAHGVARAVEDAGWLLDMLHRLTDAQETGRPAPWRLTDAPQDYIQQQLRAIVGIEITIDRLEGRLKVSQDEELADRLGTVDGLLQEGHSHAQAMAELVRHAMP